MATFGHKLKTPIIVEHLKQQELNALFIFQHHSSTWILKYAFKKCNGNRVPDFPSTKKEGKSSIV